MLFDKLIKYNAFLVLLLGVGFISIFSDDSSKCQHLPILTYQSFHPLLVLGQDRKGSSHRSKEKFSALNGILLVSVLIRSVGPGSPIGPKH